MLLDLNTVITAATVGTVQILVYFLTKPKNPVAKPKRKRGPQRKRSSAEQPREPRLGRQVDRNTLQKSQG